MDSLLEEHEKLSERVNLSKGLQDVQQTMDMLVKARDSINDSELIATITFNVADRLHCEISLIIAGYRFSVYSNYASQASECDERIVRCHQK